jgi:uncharacterized repeat protein (TIGR03843 family)
VAAFDVVANNADRKGGHCLVDRDEHVWAIDNGLCFHVEPKLRTVAWDFADGTVDDELLHGLVALAQGEVPQSLTSLLSGDEIEALVSRAGTLCATRRYPRPTTEYPYPWPLI